MTAVEFRAIASEPGTSTMVQRISQSRCTMLVAVHPAKGADHYPGRLNHYPVRVNHYPVRVNHYPVRVNHYPVRLNHYPLRLNHY